MSDKLIFITHDVTPEHWADFYAAADITPDARGGDTEPTKLYILIHSPSQRDLEAKEHIETTVKSQFSSATWEEIRACFKAFQTRDPQHIHPVVFLILDRQSIEDRKVIIVNEGMAQWFTPEGEYADDTMQDRDDLEKRRVWQKYRVPFEEAWTVQCAIEGCCSLEAAEPYFEKDLMGDIYVEPEPESEEETDSDETTSEDLEYM